MNTMNTMDKTKQYEGCLLMLALYSLKKIPETPAEEVNFEFILSIRKFSSFYGLLSWRPMISFIFWGTIISLYIIEKSTILTNAHTILTKSTVRIIKLLKRKK